MKIKQKNENDREASDVDNTKRAGCDYATGTGKNQNRKEKIRDETLDHEPELDESVSVPWSRDSHYVLIDTMRQLRARARAL